MIFKPSLTLHHVRPRRGHCSTCTTPGSAVNPLTCLSRAFSFFLKLVASAVFSLSSSSNCGHRRGGAALECGRQQPQLNLPQHQTSTPKVCNSPR